VVKRVVPDSASKLTTIVFQKLGEGCVVHGFDQMPIETRLSGFLPIFVLSPTR